LTALRPKPTMARAPTRAPRVAMFGPIPPDQFWGKLEPRDARPVPRWHPLVDHCCDVAMMTEALLTRTLLGRRLATLAGREELDEVTVARLCR